MNPSFARERGAEPPPPATPRPSPGSAPLLRRLVGTRWLRPLNDPVAIDDLLNLVHPTWSIAEVRARVVATIRETADARTLVLAPNRLWPGHRAGQHVAVTIEYDGRRHTRTFSLSSPPRRDGLLHITVKRREGGNVSHWWNGRARSGDVVTLSAPAGTFLLPEPLPPRIVMLSAGSGITPLMAMLRDLDARDAGRGVLFVHCARSKQECIFDRELHEIARRRPWLELRVHLSGECGRFGAADFAGFASRAVGAPMFVCGPASFLQQAEHAWHEAKSFEVAGSSFHAEHFGLPPRSAGQGGSQTVEAARSGRTFVAAGGQSLLAAAEASGLSPKHGCRMGVCHTCKCRKISGVVEDLRDGRISSEPGEMIQLCVSTARSGVTLEL